eukprot:GFYU01007624.1.p1 GENE.GFYU01007624.1~~GFYU01007624.1.p1  ORF type:complete len:314 (-),score=98.47 GFYU01007624.1:569-1510(-)
MDCSIVPVRGGQFSLISTTDFFYPLVNDPYMQGKIGCANVLSDLYSMGIVETDNMLMILAASRDMSKKERDVTTSKMMAGFRDLCEEAGCKVTGGQSVLNPWPIIGGAAMSVCSSDEFIAPFHAVEGDVVVLTKPIGTQPAVNAFQWMQADNDQWREVKAKMGDSAKEQVIEAYRIAMGSMARLNRTGARMMHKYEAHAATDVTGFGYLGHAINVAQNQKAKVDLEIHTLPIIKGSDVVNEVLNFKLMTGYSAETSGGLMICLPAKHAEAFCKDMYDTDGCPAWIVGRVVKGTNTARIVENPKIINVEEKEYL